MPGATAAVKVAGKAAGRGSTKAATSTRWAGKQASVLRGRGMTDAQIRAELKGAGYDAATSKAAAPAKASPAPAPSEPAAEPPTAAAEPEPAVRSTPTGRSAPVSVGGDTAGFALGLVATAILINFMRGGPDQVRAWGRAKFLNQTAGSPAAAAPVPDPNKVLPGAGIDPKTLGIDPKTLRHW
jgi:hypothetical protein